MSHQKPDNILKQPTAVWAVAFASVIAFMGIGLVDPILPAIAASLQATPTQTEMLFTSYLLITGVAMFFTSWISSRIGAKRTLLIGLALIVVFALAAGLSQNVWSIIGFRAGWGLGNALFISTALATIVGAAAGGTSAAIILYEAALGLGIAIGPLLGGLLGSWSWRGPFFGTATLMAIGFIAIVVMLKKNPEKPSPTKLSAPFRALGRPALGFLAAAALFYNIGFFVLLAYTPFALADLGVKDAITLGLIFFGWGVALALTSVWVAPLLTARLPRTRVLWLIMPLLALDLAAAGLLVGSLVALIVCVIVGGLLLGILNTVLTECVMEATDLPRSVASSAYSGVRFLGGAIAPPAATLLASLFARSTPFYAGAISVLIAAALVMLGHKHLKRVDAPHETREQEAEVLALADAD
ncbi:MFS transporter [Leifsonia shinshuensis]|uniref:Putative MFS family arabinose efflux permease n=1 Tax=Leifsonia shinshuensis TaxID=150026 RepID=A0A853CXP0_9MICO|nr:MFS transporter [Leifsonia shinshuensis]NYJ25288.1 putative MFS family arabinose efflux permease [Leifsonia shinshuensis]